LLRHFGVQEKGVEIIDPELKRPKALKCGGTSCESEFIMTIGQRRNTVNLPKVYEITGARIKGGNDDSEEQVHVRKE
jgi:hypothetical protein